MSNNDQPNSGLPPVKLIKRKHQRTIRIRVRDDEIVVSGPASVSRDRMLDFVREKKAWIRKTCDRHRERIKNMEEQRKILEGTLLLRGQRKPIRHFPVPGLRKPELVEYESTVVHQFDPFGYNGNSGESLQADPDLIQTFYRNLANKELRDRFDYWVRRLPYQPSRLSVRNQKTKWGSCSARGTISLNWRLIKCPPDIADYIIIHELCHLKHLNHSSAYWNTVAAWYPSFKEARNWIRRNSDEIFGDY